VRQSSGGLPFVKALGVPSAGGDIVPVSMNLTNYQHTPIRRVFDAVRAGAAQEGVEVVGSEIVGLVPAAALADTTPADLKLVGFTDEQILDTRLA
jgi:glutamate formiminotransferase